MRDCGFLARLRAWIKPGFKFCTSLEIIRNKISAIWSKSGCIRLVLKLLARWSAKCYFKDNVFNVKISTPARINTQIAVKGFCQAVLPVRSNKGERGPAGHAISSLGKIPSTTTFWGRYSADFTPRQHLYRRLLFNRVNMGTASLNWRSWRKW